MDKLTFEQRLEQVEEIIRGIESGQLPLEDSVRKFEAGMKSLNELEKDLGEMKRRIAMLQENPDGTLSEQPAEELQ